MEKKIEINYTVAIDTVPLPEEPAERISIIRNAFKPVISQMFDDAMWLAIGTWPTTERPDSIP